MKRLFKLKWLRTYLICSCGRFELRWDLITKNKSYTWGEVFKSNSNFSNYPNFDFSQISTTWLEHALLIDVTIFFGNVSWAYEALGYRALLALSTIQLVAELARGLQLTSGWAIDPSLEMTTLLYIYERIINNRMYGWYDNVINNHIKKSKFEILNFVITKKSELLTTYFLCSTVTPAKIILVLPKV